MKASQRITETAVLCWLLTLIAVLYSITPIHNGNIFWHLRNGIDIVETGEIRTADPFTWTRHGAYWIQHEWLAETAMALSWIHLGEAGPVLLKALFIGLSVLFAFKASLKNGASPGTAFVVGAVWLALAQPRWISRPHFFSIFFFSLYLYILSFKTHKPWKLTLFLFPLQVLWVNVHAGFVMGIFLASVPAMRELFSGRYKIFLKWLIPPAVLVLASGIHPNGFRTLEYLPSFLAHPLFKQSIREWWSPFDPRYAPERTLSRTALLFSGLTLGTAVLLLVFKKAIDRGRVAALTVLVAATAFAARNGELLAPAMLAWIPGMLRLKLTAKYAAVLAVVLAAVPFVYGIPREIGPPKQLGAGVDWSVYPVELASLLEENPALMENAVVFNTNEISGYLEFRFGERFPLFMDGRCLLYPEGLYWDYLMIAESPGEEFIGLQNDLFNRYGFNLLIYNTRSSSSSVYLAAKLPQWVPIQICSLTSTYAKWKLLEETGLESLAFRYFDPLDPGEFISTPLYQLPSSALSELKIQRDQLGSRVLNHAVEALQFRSDTSFTPELDENDRGIWAETIRCWENCRSGNLQAAAASAAATGDLSLQSAVSWLQNGEFAENEGIAGIPVELAETRWNRKAIHITALWITGQQTAALCEADLFVDSLQPWGIAQCAWLYSLSGNQVRAGELSTLALSRAHSPMVLERAARVCRGARDFPGTVELCRMALAVSPFYSEARMLLANSLWDMGNTVDAGTEYRRLQDGGFVLPDYASERLLLLRELENRYTPSGGEGT